MTPIEMFPAAKKYLQQWIGRLSQAPTVQAHDPLHQARRIKAIQTIMRKHGLDAEVHDFMEQKFGTRSTKELGPADLEKVYTKTMALKRARGL